MDGFALGFGLGSFTRGIVGGGSSSSSRRRGGLSDELIVKKPKGSIVETSAYYEKDFYDQLDDLIDENAEEFCLTPIEAISATKYAGIAVIKCIDDEIFSLVNCGKHSQIKYPLIVPHLHSSRNHMIWAPAQIDSYSCIMKGMIYNLEITNDEIDIIWDDGSHECYYPTSAMVVKKFKYQW